MEDARDGGEGGSGALQREGLEPIERRGDGRVSENR